MKKPPEAKRLIILRVELKIALLQKVLLQPVVIST